ncbi:MAG: tRNA 4-thiouridine(8) synthase ThiI [Porticoccus sp.]|nr:MAG: tRNA 4-thiouridine(8) synthase ThiI [Porticoccus sp.]
MHFIVKLFPEITIKSPSVRKRMTRQLRDNLRKLLLSINPDIHLQQDWEKIQVVGPVDEELVRQVVDLLGRTPGIAKFDRIQRYPLGDFDDVVEKTLIFWRNRLDNKNFAVRVKRVGEHGFKSSDLERYVGAALLNHCGSARVNLKRPDVTVRLEIRHNELYVIQAVYPGLGGFPLGTQDAVISLLSGGFDSSVASYLTIKRGLCTHYLFFNLGGRAHEVGVKQVASYLWHKYASSHQVHFITIPFAGVVEEILTKVGNAEMGVVLKRMMLRVASEVARGLKIDAVVTGESVAQVSSQTLANLAVIDAVTDALVLRPLITADKGEIIDIARAIGVEVFAANMPEYCGVISVRPTTRATGQKVAHEEEKFDFSVLEHALAHARVQTIDEVLSDNDIIPVDIFENPPPDSVILDIRHPEEVCSQPLNVPEAEVELMPFYTLQGRFRELKQASRYVLYCDRGVMSRLHAEHLIEQGFCNVGVYRPVRK